MGIKSLFTPGGKTLKAKDFADVMFPVGAIYITIDNHNPGTFLSGTWIQLAQGRTLIGVGTSNDGTKSETFRANGTGGKHYTPKLRAAIGAVNSDTHSIGYRAEQPISGFQYTYDLGVKGTTGNGSLKQVNHSTSVVTETGAETFRPLIPYQTVYFWRRTA